MQQQLEKEIKAINDGIGFDIYRGTIEDIDMRLELFKSWNDLIEKGKQSNDSKIQTISKQLEAKVKKVQQKEFPKMRKEYADIADKLLWEHNIDVTVTGTGNKYINLTGGIFASNGNIKDTQTELKLMLYKLRFNQTRYRWYRNQDEYTYYNMKGKSDTEPVTLLY
ncbi:MAG: hypothetical protein LBU51_07555 [Bacteroidales bacterium]|nr:hypothetical protein [Bacteroidales bacterium]